MQQANPTLTPDTKNRVGRFFSLAAESVGKDSRSSRKHTGEKRGYRYDTTSVDTEFEYGPFGELIRATGEKRDDFNFRFSTKYEDAETGLLYYGYRYYCAETGRWLSRDPIEEQGGLNLYGFIGNDSVNYVDYLGLTISVDPTLKGPGIRDTLTGRIASRADFRAQINRISGPSTSLNPRAAYALTVGNAKRQRKTGHSVMFAKATQKVQAVHSNLFRSILQLALRNTDCFWCAKVKAKKDRMLPIGQRALGWLRKYIDDVRPALVVYSLSGKRLFLTEYGEPMLPKHLSYRVRSHIRKADMGLSGSCHIFRHTTAWPC